MKSKKLTVSHHFIMCHHYIEIKVMKLKRISQVFKKIAYLILFIHSFCVCVCVYISDIVVQILGIGKCEWSEQRRTYQSEEIYLKMKLKFQNQNKVCGYSFPLIYSFL